MIKWELLGPRISQKWSRLPFWVTKYPRCKDFDYREIKKVDHEKFRNDISNLPLTEIWRFPDTLTGFVTLFRSVVERHEPIKMKTIRGNNKPFMNSELSNAIKQKSKLRNKHNKKDQGKVTLTGKIAKRGVRK